MEAKDPTENLTWFNQEMDDCASGYAAYVLEQVEEAKKTCPDPVVLIEQRVDFSRWVEEGFRTADAIVIADGTLQIIDYKHGLGVLVSAEENPQMMCYALGALELFDGIYDIDSVQMTIFQPRRSNLSTYELSKEDLLRWADEVLKPAADLAFAGDGNFLRGEWCTFCKCKSSCRARAEANIELARYDFKLPPLLTDENVEDILGKVDELVSWASDIKEYALQQAISGKVWSGFKLVEGRVIAWIAGESWRQEVFANGGDIYCASASQMFKVPVVKHGINGHLRQKGKISELALGYGGSVGALKAMGALEMGLDENELPSLVEAWRQSNLNIVKLWWDVDRAAMVLSGKLYGVDFVKLFGADFTLGDVNGQFLR